MGWVTDNAFFMVVAILLAYGLYTTTGLALSTEVPVVAVTSGSMEPHLSRGDMILVEGVNFSELSAGTPGQEDGDIIVYTTDQMPVPVIHRVIEKNGTALQTKGDNNEGQHPFETYVTAEQIQGKAFFTVPLIGHVKLTPMCILLRMQHPPGTDLSPLCPDEGL